MKEDNSKDNKWEKGYEKFKIKFPTVKACKIQLRKNWCPEYYICPDCGHNERYSYKHKQTNIRLYQCKSKDCKHQASVTSATKIFKKTRTPLTIWFKMIFLIAQRGKHISAMEIIGKLKKEEKKYTTVDRTIYSLRKKIEEGLNQESAFKIFKGIAREKDIKRYQDNKLIEKIDKYNEAKKKKSKK